MLIKFAFKDYNVKGKFHNIVVSGKKADYLEM